LIARRGAAITPAVEGEILDSSGGGSAAGLRRGSVATAGVFGRR
jgi:hypothetical protein